MATDAPTVVTVSASSLQAGRRVDDLPVTAPVAGHENVVVQVLQPITIIAVRASRVFLQTMLATLSAGAIGVMPASDFTHLLIQSASISVASGVYCIIQNMIELLARFDQSHPTLAG